MNLDRIVDPNRGVRRVLYALGGSVALLGVVLSAAKDWCILPLVLFAVLGMIVIVMSALSFPYVEMRPDGVLVRFLLRRRHYCWSEIICFGRYWRNRKEPAKESFSLLLWCPPGKGKKIQLPNERQIRLYIVEHYGPLDFDDYKGISSWEKKSYKLDET